MNLFRILLLGLITATPLQSWAVAAESDPFIEEKSFSWQCPSDASQKKIWPYSILKPSHQDKSYPLVVALHGRGGSGRDYLQVWAPEALRRGVMVFAPTWETPNVCKMTEQEDQQFIRAMIQSVLNEYPVDTKRVYLAGVSAGSLIAQWFSPSSLDLWRGVIFIAGPPFNRYGALSLDDRKHYPPILVVHGAEDSQFPLDKIKENFRMIAQRKGLDALLVMKNAGHEHRPEWNKRIFEWIESVERTDKSPAA